MAAIVAFRAKIENDWSVHKCRRSGEITFDAYRACHLARWYCQRGNAEARVMKGAEVFARFWRGPTGEIHQEGGVNL